MSSPWKKIVPPVTSYSGEASSVLARVLLPEPLGPMMACASPALTVSDSPRRISPAVRRAAVGRICAGRRVQILDAEQLACGVVMRTSVFPLSAVVETPSVDVGELAGQRRI